jgi:hypothetical protein
MHLQPEIVNPLRRKSSTCKVGYKREETEGRRDPELFDGLIQRTQRLLASRLSSRGLDT